MSTASAVVLVTSSFPIERNGSEAAGSFVADLVQSMRAFAPVRVVAPGKSTDHEFWSEGVEVFRFEAPARPLSTLRPWHPREMSAIGGVLRRGLLTTHRAVNAGPCSRIVALWALPCGQWARAVARESSLPYTFWTLGSDIWSLGRIPLVRRYLRGVLSDADARFSDGLQLAEDTRRICGRAVEFLPSTRLISSVRSEPLRTVPPYRLLFLGRWHRNKGIDLLMEALGRLREEDWRRIERIDICGGGPLEELVRGSAAALSASGRPVRCHGYLDKAEAEQAFLDANYLLLPSRIESIPVVFSDAMKLSCPVISTPVGDLPRLVGGSHPTGVLARSASSEAIAEAISVALLTSPAVFAEGMRLARGMFDLHGVAARLAGTPDP